MKQFDIFRIRELFPGSDVIRKYSFKTLILRDSYALLAVLNHQLLAISAVIRDKSAHFHIYDCFECPSPHTIAA